MRQRFTEQFQTPSIVLLETDLFKKKRERERETQISVLWKFILGDRYKQENLVKYIRLHQHQEK